MWVWINSVVEIIIVWYVDLFIKFCIEWFVVELMLECDSGNIVWIIVYHELGWHVVVYIVAISEM